MDINLSKLALVQHILQTENEDLIAKVLELFDSQEEDFWNQLSKNQQEDILKGISESIQEKGKKWSDVRDRA